MEGSGDGASKKARQQPPASPPTPATAKRLPASRLAAPLRLHLHLPIRDVRKLIWRKLTPEDCEVVRFAQNSLRPQDSATQEALNAIYLHSIKSGYLELAKWAKNAGARDRGFGLPLCYYAALGGHQNILDWLGVNVSDFRVIQQGAAVGGHTALLLQFASHTRRHHFPEHIFESVARNGHLHILEYFAMLHFTFNARCYLGAAESGHVHIMEWLRQGQHVPTTMPVPLEVYIAAAKHGHVAVLEWARTHQVAMPDLGKFGASLVSSECKAAVRWACNYVPDVYFKLDGSCGKNTAFLSFLLHETYCCAVDWDVFVYDSIQHVGRLDVVRWAVREAPYLLQRTEIMRAAARANRIAILEWGHEQGATWNEEVCSAAAGGGHLDVLQWLRSREPPCPWDERTCAYAAECNHLHVLVWARVNGAPWNAQRLLAHALERENGAVWRWVNAQINNAPC